MIIDAKDLIAGRIATVAAKKALLGEEVSIVNAELAVITGRKKNIMEKYKARANRGNPHHGPFQPKTPDKMLRRMIRGMLPHKQGKGKLALKRIKCYKGIPEEFKNKKLETIEKANIAKIQNLRYLSIGQICQSLKQR